MSKKSALYIIFIIIGISGFSVSLDSQSSDIYFEKVIGSRNVPIGKINGMTQDHYGFMWFSDQTNGAIIRYDGNQFKHYKFDPNDTKSLGGFYPECIVADPSGYIWIGYYGQGLDRFDPETETFEHFQHDPSDPSSLISNVVCTIMLDSDQRLWIGTSEGVSVLNQESGKFINYKHDPNDATSLSHNFVRSMLQDKNGDIWIGTGFSFQDGDEGGLNKFNKSNQSFTRYLHDPGDPKSLFNNKVRALYEDSKGNLWVGTRDNGVQIMDRDRKEFDEIKLDFTHSPISTNTSQQKLVTFIREDSQGYMWIGTNSDGLIRYNNTTQEAEYFYGNDLNKNKSYPDFSGWWAHTSLDGFVWISNQEGNLYKVDLFTATIPFEDEFPGKVFHSSYPNELWIGTENGLYRKVNDTGQVKKYIHDNDDSHSISDNDIQAIFRESDNTYWVGTSNGLNKFNPEKEEFISYFRDPNDPESLSNNDILSIAGDKNGNIWIGTNGGGLNKWNSTQKKVERVQFSLPHGNYFSNNVSALYADSLNGLWVGTKSGLTPGGLFKHDIKTGVWQLIYNSVDVYCFFQAKDGNVWVGTIDGIIVVNPETDEYQKINLNATVYSIIDDSEGILYASSNYGILRFESEESYTTYIVANALTGVGFQVGLTGEATCRLKNGQLLFGNLRGYYRVDPKNLLIPPSKANLIFTRFNLNGEDVFPNKNSILQEPIFKTSAIELAHDQNIFELDFTRIDFRNFESNLIEYKFENYDNLWRNAKIEEPVSYFKVPPGEYEFKIKTTTNNSSEYIEKSLAINILPPWYHSWWAYIFYGLVIISGILLADRIQRKRVIAKERARSQAKELEQAREIEKAYTKLKSTQSQLIHSEKMASLGELTAGIAHEIQNPLNFVNNFSEVSEEMVDEVNEEMDEGDFNEAREILQDLKGNLKKISHHGHRASNIVKNMMEHSRAGSGEQESTDINALCEEYLRLAYHGMKAKDRSFKVTMETNFDESLPRIKVVPQDIGRVLLNLINNALQALSSETLGKENEDYTSILSVSTKNLRDKIQITVSDNGPGIPDDIKDKIFQPFFTTKPTGEGTGLGLSLSYDIIKAHSGKLKVDSKERKGSTFTIILPA